MVGTHAVEGDRRRCGLAASPGRMTFGRHARSALAAVALLAGGVLAGCAAKAPAAPPPPAVVVAHPAQRTVVDWDDFLGQFEAVDSVDVRPRVTGYLQSVGFRDGELVRKGQVLFVIDPRPYQAILDQAKGQAAHAG